MKANEAPEKIYLEKVYTDNGILPNGLNYNQSPNDIEYVRKDAFIEKALRFFKTKFDVEDYYYDKTINGDRVFSYNKLISDFKDYLQNESEMPKKP